MVKYVIRQLQLLVVCCSFLNACALYAQPHLFKEFPQLQFQIPYQELCDLPTPIIKLDTFGACIGADNVYIKRDDLSGKNMGNDFRLYGGNKPRKLEFLLADALAHDAHTIITYGCAGSNHALATAVYAQELGLQAILMLKAQPNSHVVRHNLLLDTYVGAQLHFYSNNAMRSVAANALLQADPHAYLIPTGGSNPIGALGFVNAAFELRDQIQDGVMPEPDLMYVATGSCATAAGLLLGVKLAGLKCKVVAVGVEPDDDQDAYRARIQELFYATNLKLNAADATVPLVEFPEQDLMVNKKYGGIEYGLFIPEGMRAARLFKETEGIMLEGTYSAKPVAAIIDDAAAGLLEGKTVLFWNTYCGIDYSGLSAWDDYKQLPLEFQNYFTEDVQPLAREEKTTYISNSKNHENLESAQYMKLIPKSFYFIRHGQTDWNKEHRLQGQTDIPLNDAGREQAAALQDLVSTIDITHVYYSPLSRTTETMHLACKHVDVPKMELYGLKERHFGEWEGTIWDEVKRDTHLHFVPINGESYPVFHERVVSDVNRVLNESEGAVLLVGHAGIFRAFCRAIDTTYEAVHNCRLFYFMAPNDTSDQWQIFEL